MFPAPIAFLNDKLKAELGMKSKKEEEDADDEFCSLKVPIDHEDKESKTYMVKVKKYHYGAPEELMKWRLTLNEKLKNNGYDANYDNVMNLAQAMLAGHSLEEFLNEKRYKKQIIESTSPRPKRNIPPRKFMTLPFLNWQFVLLTSKVDGEMPTRGI
jgi:hypothetical protein